MLTSPFASFAIRRCAWTAASLRGLRGCDLREGVTTTLSALALFIFLTKLISCFLRHLCPNCGRNPLSFFFIMAPIYGQAASVVETVGAKTVGAEVSLE